MGLLPISKRESNFTDASNANPVDWIAVAAGGSLLVGGFLLLTGQRRAGMVAAASGTALALLDQQETLRSWWTLIPGYVDEVQQIIGRVQGVVEDIAAKRESLQQVLAKTGKEA
jgi:hypothetical protein